MRKINDRELQEMLQSGMPQNKIAQHFNVSPAAICIRIKKLRAYAPPESFKKLTAKEKAFVLAKAEGKNNMEAVKASYDVSTDASAKSMATVLMRDPDINVAIQDLMAQEGITRRRRVQRLRDMIECPDLGIVGRGLDMAAKMAGDFAPVQIETISAVEIRALGVLVNAALESGDVIEGETVEGSKKGD